MAQSKHNKQNKINIIFKIIRMFIKTISLLIPPLGVAIAYRMFFSCRSFARPSHEWKQYKSAKKYRLDMVGKEIQIYEWGDGKKRILFHHGWQGRGSSVAAFVEPLIEAGYKVVAFDGPAHGESTGKQSNLPEFADALNQIVERFNGFDAIIAHSFGGMVSSYAIQKYNMDIKRLIFIASPFTMSFIVSSFSQIINTTAYVGKRIIKKIEKQFKLKISDMSGENLAPKQHLPLLLIHDKDDIEVPLEQSEYQHKLWKGSLLVRTDGLGHRRILRNENVIFATIEFIKQKHEIAS